MEQNCSPRAGQLNANAWGSKWSRRQTGFDHELCHCRALARRWSMRPTTTFLAAGPEADAAWEEAGDLRRFGVPCGRLCRKRSEPCLEDTFFSLVHFLLLDGETS